MLKRNSRRIIASVLAISSCFGNGRLQLKSKEGNIMKKKMMILCIILITLLNISFSAFSAHAHISSEYTSGFETAKIFYKAKFTLDMNKYPKFKDTWLYELSEDDELEIEFVMGSGTQAMRIFGKDGEIFVEPYESPWDISTSVADETKEVNGIFIFYSPYDEGWYENTGKTFFEWFPAKDYRSKETTDEKLREKYSGQHFILTLENNDNDERIKFYGINFKNANKSNATDPLEPEDELIFDFGLRPTTEIIRIDKEDTFTGNENYSEFSARAKKRNFNDNAEYYYYRGCEGYDGEYEWVAPPSKWIKAYKKHTNEDGEEVLYFVYNTDRYDNVNYTYDEAVAYIKEHYPPIPVTDPIAEPDLTPTEEDLKKAELAAIGDKYPTEEYYITDEKLPSGNKEQNIKQYGKYKDKYGNVHNIMVINGKLRYEDFVGELTGVARFKIYNNTAAWFDKVSSDGTADVEIRHYVLNSYVDGVLYEGNIDRYFMRISGDKDEIWYYTYNTYHKDKFSKANLTIRETLYKPKTDESYYLFEPVTEFSESYIDLYPGNERNVEVIIKFENEDRLEFENITLKRNGTVLDTAETEEIIADLGFRLFSFNQAYREDGSMYKQYLPDDYDRLMNSRAEYVKKYEDVVIDINSDFEEEKDEEEKVDPNKEIEVFVDGKKLEFDVDPIIVNGRTLVPMRAIFEALGAKVEWYGDTQTVTAKISDTLISLKIGDNKLYKNGIETELEASPVLYNGRTLVPVRAVSESFERNVEWDEKTRTVTID